MTTISTINVARDFSQFPGPRLIQEGPHSGEAFREQILLPKFRAAQDAGGRVAIELDGVRYGYPTSFLEEAFGGLARQVGSDIALRHLHFVSTEDLLLRDEIERYIRYAFKTSEQRQRATA